MEFTLLWAALTGVTLAWLGTRIWQDGLPQKPVDLLIGASAAGLLTGRLAAMMSQGINPVTDPVQIILVRGGVSTGFAVIGALAALAWALRGHLTLLDALAPASLLGLAGWHAGCLWRSACLGAESDLPWAWALEGSTIPRHPVEIYAALALALAAYGVSRLPWSPFARSGIALAAAGMVRLVTQPMRLTLTGGPMGWYVAGIAVGLAAAKFGPALAGRLRTPPN